jgi:hypothetical protein
VLFFFGTTGEITHLNPLIETAGLKSETAASRDLVKDGVPLRA